MPVHLAKSTAGDRVLVHGAAGGVGVFAVQLARWRGATVIGTASAHNAAFVHGLGADEVIDYRAVRFEDIVHCDLCAVLFLAAQLPRDNYMRLREFSRTPKWRDGILCTPHRSREA